ncbi:Poly(A) polymerase [Phytophthora cinnamomi]|uniref:Poly(A) polymerase n=1 Tax=Phytophthora cinnamomi TaxID=4785 RepID=UPI003559F012|nr:Poly(A) polymerase [Phytophthora cinnamomi]
MDASAPEAAAGTPPRPRASPQPQQEQKQTPQSARAPKAELGDYREAAWFQAGEGDLVFAQWLLGRCNGVGDAATPQSVEAAQRVFALFKTQRRLRRELAMGSKRVSADADADAEEDEAETHEEVEEPLRCTAGWRS